MPPPAVKPFALNLFAAITGFWDEFADWAAGGAFERIGSRTEFTFSLPPLRANHPDHHDQPSVRQIAPGLRRGRLAGRSVDRSLESSNPHAQVSRRQLSPSGQPEEPSRRRRKRPGSPSHNQDRLRGPPRRSTAVMPRQGLFFTIGGSLFNANGGSQSADRCHIWVSVHQHRAAWSVDAWAEGRYEPALLACAGAGGEAATGGVELFALGFVAAFLDAVLADGFGMRLLPDVG